MHWVMDMVFRDDECRVRTEHAPANFTTIKHMAHNLIRKAPGKDSLRLRRKVEELRANDPGAPPAAMVLDEVIDDIANFRGVTSHVNYRPTGKWDIGPAFDWERLIKAVGGKVRGAG